MNFFPFIHSLLYWPTSVLVESPLYPHWLNNLKARELEDTITPLIHGLVLEVGAGDTAKKARILQNSPKIVRYVATDYSSWDDEFAQNEKKISLLGEITSRFFGFRSRGHLDMVCDAMQLPFANSVFHTHISFEVLEHIHDPFAYFSEAARVVKPGGRIILSVPAFYRVHGVGPRHDFDYFRYMPGFFYEIARKNDCKCVAVLHNTGLGTTIAQMTNQYIIEIIRKSTIILRLALIPCAAILFPITNSIGYLIDLFPDIRFANRYMVVLQKQA